MEVPTISKQAAVEIIKQNLVSRGVILDSQGRVSDVTHEFLLNKINDLQDTILRLELRIKELELKEEKRSAPHS